MIAAAIKDCSGRGDIILDIFGGSGSTLIAAEKTGRRGYLCELDPVYCDRIIRRWEVYAKDEAIRVVEGTSISSIPRLTESGVWSRSGADCVAVTCFRCRRTMMGSCTVRMAEERKRFGSIHHSDRGSQYATVIYKHHRRA